MDDKLIQQALADAEKFDVDDDKLKGVAALANEQLRLEQLKSDLEEALKKTNLDLAAIQDKKLPDALLDAGQSKFTTADGKLEVKLKKMYLPSVTEENKEKVWDWMHEHKFDGIIKADVVIPLGKGGYAQAKKIAEALKKMIQKKNPESEYLPIVVGDVHWQTFRAFAREQTEAAAEDKVAFPPELRVHEITRAEIKVNKKGK